jgi:hypothetical protein
MLRRTKLFVEWYKKLRAHRKKHYDVVDTPLHPSYNMVNCFLWAWYNSKRFNIDGTYKCNKSGLKNTDHKP